MRGRKQVWALGSTAPRLICRWGRLAAHRPLQAPTIWQLDARAGRSTQPALDNLVRSRQACGGPRPYHRPAAPAPTRTCSRICISRPEGVHCCAMLRSAAAGGAAQEVQGVESWGRSEGRGGGVKAAASTDAELHSGCIHSRSTQGGPAGGLADRWWPVVRGGAVGPASCILSCRQRLSTPA